MQVACGRGLKKSCLASADEASLQLVAVVLLFLLHRSVAEEEVEKDLMKQCWSIPSTKRHGPHRIVSFQIAASCSESRW